MIKKHNKIFVAGHNGLIGSAIVKQLKLKGYKNIITIDKKKLNLLNQNDVFKFLKKIKPKVTIIAAAKVGGIYANNVFRGSQWSGAGHYNFDSPITGPQVLPA